MVVTSRQRKRAPEPASGQSVSVPPLRKRPAWALLAKHYQKLKGVHLRQLFADDRGRGDRLAVEAAGLCLDYSKNRITDETLRLLLQLARGIGAAEPGSCLIWLTVNRMRCLMARPSIQVSPLILPPST